MKRIFLLLFVLLHIPGKIEALSLCMLYEPFETYYDLQDVDYDATDDMYYSMGSLRQQWYCASFKITDTASSILFGIHGRISFIPPIDQQRKMLDINLFALCGLEKWIAWDNIRLTAGIGLGGTSIYEDFSGINPGAGAFDVFQRQGFVGSAEFFFDLDLKLVKSLLAEASLGFQYNFPPTALVENRVYYGVGLCYLFGE